MPGISQKITPFLWFDDQAEAAARFYTAIFPDSRVVSVTPYSPEAAAMSGRAPGTAMTVAFVLNGQDFGALNGGPQFRFTEAISFVVHCESQDEIDYYWERLTDGGDPAAQQCGWLKDRFGVSWQVVPTALDALLNDPDEERARRVTNALLQMRKLDLPALQRAADGQDAASPTHG